MSNQMNMIRHYDVSVYDETFLFLTIGSPYQERHYFYDEMRSGTRTVLKKRWSAMGHRPSGKQRIGYEYVYLYAAIAC